MNETDRVKLLGTYLTPRFHCGDVVTCAIRGPVKIVGLSSGRIPWPKCRSGGTRAIIIYGALADAVRRESAQAVGYWFGVGQVTVWKWRAALGVGRKTEGTAALYSRWTPDEDALLGTMTDREVAAQLGKAQSTVSARRYRVKVAAFVKRGPKRPAPPWTPERDALLGTMSDVELAQRLRCSPKAVSFRRRKLGVPRFVENS